MKTLPELRAYSSGLQDSLVLLKESVDLTVEILPSYTVGDLLENMSKNLSVVFKDVIEDRAIFFEFMLTGLKDPM